MIPLQTYSLTEIAFGPAVLLVGIFALLLFAAVQFKNPAAVILWAFSLILFVFSGLFGVGVELVWISVLVTLTIVIIGLVARWTQ